MTPEAGFAPGGGFKMSMAAVRLEGGATLAAPTGRGAPADRVLASRVRVLTEVAERYGELVDPLGGPAGLRGDGDAVGLMPRTYTATVREFERLVVRLRSERRELWWHLDAWWLSAGTRTAFHCPRCGITHRAEHVHPSRKNGRPMRVRCKRVVMWSRRQGAQKSLAEAAIEWVASEWGLGSEPMLPDELRVV